MRTGGRRRLLIVISAGPTREPLDPVRFISNYSTGTMGAALAEETIRRGHQAVVVSGPTTTPFPRRARRIAVEQAAAGRFIGVGLELGGNDAALVLAGHFPGKEEAFVDAMNEKAKNLGLEQTHYMNPAGLHHPLHLSSTHDLVSLTKAALQYPEFVQIVGTAKITVSSVDGSQQHQLFNRNKLLGTIPGVKGVKTGWTEEAGEALVT